MINRTIIISPPQKQVFLLVFSPKIVSLKIFPLQIDHDSVYFCHILARFFFLIFHIMGFLFLFSFWRGFWAFSPLLQVFGFCLFVSYMFNMDLLLHSFSFPTFFLFTVFPYSSSPSFSEAVLTCYHLVLSWGIMNT